jgi:hypothetical protein
MKLRWCIVLLLFFSGQWSWGADLPKHGLLLDSFGRNVASTSTVISAERFTIT